MMVEILQNGEEGERRRKNGAKEEARDELLEEGDARNQGKRNHKSHIIESKERMGMHVDKRERVDTMRAFDAQHAIRRSFSPDTNGVWEESEI